MELEESQEDENCQDEKIYNDNQQNNENVVETRNTEEIVYNAENIQKIRKTKRKSSTRRPWSQMESDAVISYFSSYVKKNSAAPGKNICEECLNDNKIVLKQRSWKDIKYFVYNYMKKVNKYWY